MLEIEIDGQKLEVPDGSTVMDAANRLGVYIPHFCYHKKLSIAANCRMCLVQVERAPKPLPACATPVTNGMKVQTHSDQAVTAQKGVMEFLLINHPLDCPICDQGGECQLQDLAVGYGSSASRYQEEKRVVMNKNLGPLISTDMTRCIHCTRCVRFGQEIAGVMELGMANRGEHSEIMTFVGHTVDSELSGNMIDLCPVGALTSKPFRYSARTWELSRRKTVSPHDSLGSNLVVQVKHDEVKRVLPFENEEVNECWISDRDRFSYEALNGEERLTRPMIKQDGRWLEVDWQTALEYAANGLKRVAAEQGASKIGMLAAPHSTVEELYLAAQLMRGLGGASMDTRLRQSDFRLDGKLSGIPWLGMKVADVSRLDAALVVGSFLRKDQPLIAQRLRQAARRGTAVSALGVSGEDWLMTLHARVTVAPSQLAGELAALVKAAAEARGVALPAGVESVQVSEAARSIVASLMNDGSRAIFLGSVVQQHADASGLHALAQELARLTGATLGYLVEGGNAVGAAAVGAQSGLNAQQMLLSGLRACVVLHAEPELDCANAPMALEALKAADTVIVMSPFKTGLDYADCLLPVSPFTETSGTFVNAEGRIQSFHAVVRPKGDTRPAWKVLRVLGSMLELGGFRFDSSEQVRDEALSGARDWLPEYKLGNTAGDVAFARPVALGGLQRVADFPIYRNDAIVRRAPALAAARDSAAPAARMSAATAGDAGLNAGARVRVRGSAWSCELDLQIDDTVPAGCVRVSAGWPQTAPLGTLSGALTVEAL
ncbi:NADH-quinone oxidoreductase subunit NuoG [Methyloversatilis thermotolerans]|uniref:NADH-quinone oxidoreductase subunit NuoG n=1 Tax=Methyloversatilis thermotolerans TaxID=1346290 RepID=UPI00035FEFBC|nr:NADH-quinone oxidoreductase subunit NuoG [Methyloversatilis thermotolerans]